MKKAGHILMVGLLGVLAGVLMMPASGATAVSGAARLAESGAEIATKTDASVESATSEVVNKSGEVTSESEEVTNQDIQELTESIQSLETKLELLIETLEEQNGEADTSYTEVLGANESSSHLQQEGFQKVAAGVIAGVTVVMALACLLLISLHAKNQQPQTVSEAVDAIVARNQKIYGVPKPPEMD